MNSRGLALSYIMIIAITLVVIFVSVGILLYFGRIRFVLPSFFQDFFERFTSIIWG